MGEQPAYDVCNVVGIYDNYLAKGEKSVLPGMVGRPLIRLGTISGYVIMSSRPSGMPVFQGITVLTSRGNRDIEDNELIFPNLSERKFMQAMVAGRLQ